MALGFFRRHQKMVMIIMVILMVSFLIGFQGFQSVTQRDPLKEVRGSTLYGDVRWGDLIRAGNDIHVLGYMPFDPRSPQGVELSILGRIPSEGERNLAYALLLLEAQNNKVRVGEADVEGLLASMGLTGEQYTRFLSELRTVKISEAQLRSTLERFLAIHKLFATSLVATPPSERELRYTIRDFFEKIDLRVLEFPAEKYVGQVPKITDPNLLQEQFARYRDLPPGQFSEANPFGFGYRQPDRVQVVYAYISRQVIDRAVRPTGKAVSDYYVDHAKDYVVRTRPARESDAATSPAPASAPASSPASSSAPASASAPAPRDLGPLVEVPMSFREANALIVRRLTAENSARKIEDLTNRFTALLKENPTGTSAAGPYQLAWSKMLLPQEANAALDTLVDVSSIGTMKLEAAVDRLAERVRRVDANRLTAIVFPYGTHRDANGDANITLSPEIQVHLEGSMTLREALAKICEQAKWAPIEWNMCFGLDGILFPKAGEGAVNFFPLVVHQTGLLDSEEFRKDPILANAVAMPPLRANMWALAFTSQPLGIPRQPWQTWEPMKEGEDGKTLAVTTPAQSGLVLWRLLQAVPGQAPQEMTDAIRRQVEKDLRLQKGFDLAYAQADRIRSVDQFAVADANGEANAAYATGFFARRDPSTQDWTVLPKPALPAAAGISKAFIDAAFLLAPGEGTTATISPIKLPSVRKVLVVRRVGFQPVTQGDYEDKYRDGLTAMLRNGQTQQSIQLWFAPQLIQRRVKWVPTAPSGGGRAPAPAPAPEPESD